MKGQRLLSRSHTSEFSLTSSDLANFICRCVTKNLSSFSSTSVLVQKLAFLNKLTHGRNWSSARVDMENLSRKWRNWGRTAVLFFMTTRCNGGWPQLFLLSAVYLYCWLQWRLVNSFTPANKAYQGKTGQRKLVVRTHELMKIVTDTCHGKIALV